MQDNIVYYSTTPALFVVFMLHGDSDLQALLSPFFMFSFYIHKIFLLVYISLLLPWTWINYVNSFHAL